jgi:hypothetical protein
MDSLIRVDQIDQIAGNMETPDRQQVGGTRLPLYGFDVPGSQHGLLSFPETLSLLIPEKTGTPIVCS